MYDTNKFGPDSTSFRHDPPHPSVETWFAECRYLNSHEEVLHDVAAERLRQDAQWGGPKHDDAHTPNEWHRFIALQIIAAQTRTEENTVTYDNEQYRPRLVKIAALALAALESYDRLRAAPLPSTTPPSPASERGEE